MQDVTAEVAANAGEGDSSQWSEIVRSALQELMRGETSSALKLMEAALLPAVAALLAIVFFYFLGKYLSRLISGPICSRVDETVGRFAGRCVFYGILISGVLLVLGQFGIRSTSFAAVLAAVGFAIGLAFQGTLSNFAAGMLLMIFRPFKVGDLVVAAGVHGRVYEVDLFTTSIDTLDNRRIIVPNSLVSGTTIENVTFHAHRRVEVPVGVEYRANMDATRAALQSATQSIADCTHRDETLVPQTLLAGFGASSVDWLVRVWAPSTEFNAVRDRLVYAIKTQLDQEGIQIAFPQLDIHFDDRSQVVNRATPTLEKIRPRPVFALSPDEATP